MKSYKIELNAEVIDAADVLVIGGGPSGITAAIAASRCGKSVILIECTGQLGGMATSGGVNIYMPVGNFTGIYEEMMLEFIPDAVANARSEKNPHSYAFQFDPVLFRYYLNRITEKEGVKVYFHTEFVRAVTGRTNDVTAVIVSTREGVRAIEAERFIDCTGDARVAIDAAAEYTTGRDGDNLTQPVTLMFRMQSTGKPVKDELPEDCYYYEKVEDLPQGRMLCWPDDATGGLLVNMTRVKGNGAKIEDINRYERESLKQALSVANYLQRNGFPTHRLTYVAPQTGVRQTNQIKGYYTLDLDDMTDNIRKDDVVAQTNYGIDIHNPDGSKTCDQREVRHYDIPYRCMVPVGTENLLVSGRAISADHTAMSSMRVMPTCYALGQAAGIAAAISIEHNISLKDIPICELHEIMGKQGVEFRDDALY